MAQNINPKDTLGTQSLLPISEIRNNVVILKNSSLRSIIEVKGINLLLMSSEDQEAIIYSWQSFLNNLETILNIRTKSIPFSMVPSEGMVLFTGEDFESSVTCMSTIFWVFPIAGFTSVLPFPITSFKTVVCVSNATTSNGFEKTCS